MMSQHEKMREACCEFIAAMDSCCDYPDTSSDRETLRHAKQKAQKALADVKETPKNEHGSGDVLKSAPLVRLTDGEVIAAWDGHIIPVFGKTGINVIVFANAIMDAMDKKNGGSN